MPKKFIDSDVFDDEWITDLSKDGKLAWFYFVTKCDAAGILKLNRKLFSFQTGIKSLDTVIKEFGNRIQRVSKEYVWICKYVDYQHPNGLSEASKPQAAIIKRLREFGLWDDEKSKSIQRVSKELEDSFLTVQEREQEQEQEKERGSGGKPKRERRTNDPPKDWSDLPQPLDTYEFKAAWLEFLRNKRDNGHPPIAHSSTVARWRTLAEEWGHDVAVIAVRTAAERGWRAPRPQDVEEAEISVYRQRKSQNARKSARDRIPEPDWNWRAVFKKLYPNANHKLQWSQLFEDSQRSARKEILDHGPIDSSGG